MEILLRKKFTQAEQFERRMFGKSNVVVPLEAGQELREAQNNAQENLNNANNNESKIINNIIAS